MTLTNRTDRASLNLIDPLYDDFVAATKEVTALKRELESTNRELRLKKQDLDSKDKIITRLAKSNGNSQHRIERYPEAHFSPYLAASNDDARTIRRMKDEMTRVSEENKSQKLQLDSMDRAMKNFRLLVSDKDSALKKLQAEINTDVKPRVESNTAAFRGLQLETRVNAGAISRVVQDTSENTRAINRLETVGRKTARGVDDLGNNVAEIAADVHDLQNNRVTGWLAKEPSRTIPGSSRTNGSGVSSLTHMNLDAFMSGGRGDRSTAPVPGTFMNRDALMSGGRSNGITLPGIFMNPGSSRHREPHRPTSSRRRRHSDVHWSDGIRNRHR